MNAAPPDTPIASIPSQRNKKKTTAQMNAWTP